MAGTGGVGPGLAFRILEQGYQLRIPRTFAALILIAVKGILINLATNRVSWMILRNRRESAVKREG